jgi:hypothetical protein
MKPDREIKPSGAAKPLSLAPIKFEDALSDLLKVKPPAREAKSKAKSRRPASKKKTVKRVQ